MKHRLERVCEVIKRELGLIIVRELTFPSPLITVSAVDITPDLKQAHIFVSAMGTASDKRKSLQILEQSRAMLQHELSRRIVLKHTPHLNFKLDESVERGVRVLHILEGLEIPPEEKPEGEEDEDAR